MVKNSERLANVHPDLVKLVGAVGTMLDVCVVYGFRGQAEQDKAFAEGKSKVKWPNSRHNSTPSEAVDLALIRKGKINWESKTDYILLGGVVMGMAKALNIPLRWGADWNRNFDLSDEKFVDGYHFELEKK